MNKGFVNLFFVREIKELLGRNNINLWILIGIMALTFTAIGFSNGSLDYLSVKMEDPFIQFVNIPITQKKEDSVNVYRDTLLSNYNRDRYNYSQVSYYYKFDLYFQNPINDGIYRRTGRTVEWDNPLNTAIFGMKNLIAGHSFRNDQDLGVIVTVSLLKGLDSEGATHLWMHYPHGSESERCISVPIIAIVKELPDLCEFAVTPYFYYLKNRDELGRFSFNPNHTKEFICFMAGDENQANRFRDSLQLFLNQYFPDRSPMVTRPQIDSSTYLKGYQISTNFIPEPASVVFIDSVANAVSKSISFKDVDFTQVYYYPEQYLRPENLKYDFLSIHFEKLDKIREFNSFLSSKTGINIDMAQIEAKENYSFVSNLTRLISIVLIIFSVISITFFLTNILKNHFERIKMNIGTFKAFGFEDKNLRYIYLSILGLFVGMAMIIALLCSLIFGLAGGIRGLLWVLQINLQEGENYFVLFNGWTLISVLSIIIISFTALNRLTYKIFSQHPGDLIYDRERE